MPSQKEVEIKIEVEIRGPLSSRQFKSISKVLKKKGKFFGKYNQIVIFFQENKILNLPKDSLRIKKDEAGERVCFKVKPQTEFCQEIEFSLKKGEYKKAIEFFQKIGFEDYSLAPAKREDFLYKNVKISLKDKCIIGPHYEMEIMVNEKSKIKGAKKRLLSLAHELGLKTWTQKEYLKHKGLCWHLYRKNISKRVQ